MRIRFPSTSDFSTWSTPTRSLVSNDSIRVARKAREKSHRARQKKRREQVRKDKEDEKKKNTAREDADEAGARVDPPKKTRKQGSSASLRKKGAGASGSRKAFPATPSKGNAKPSSTAPDTTATSPLKRGLYYIYNNFVPHFGVFSVDGCATPSGSFSNAPGAYPGSFIQPQPQPDPASSSSVHSDEDMSDESWTPSGSQSTSSLNTSTSEHSHSTFPSDDFESDTSASACSHRASAVPPPTRKTSRDSSCAKSHFNDPDYEAQLNYERARVARAEKLAREREAKERHEAKQKRRETKLEEQRIRLEMQEERLRREREEYERKAREQERQHKENEDDTKTAEQRFFHTLFEKYEDDKRKGYERLEAWRERDRRQQARQRTFKDSQQQTEPATHEKTHMHSGMEKERDREREWKEAEEERRRRDALNARPRDRTSKTRSTHTRAHPYARSAKLGRSHSGRHFNPYGSPSSASSSAASASASGSGSGRKKVTADPLVAHFEWYEARWTEILAVRSTEWLSFGSIPWPLLTLPRTPSDVTAARVVEFMQHIHAYSPTLSRSRAHVHPRTGFGLGLEVAGKTKARKKEMRLAAMRELKKWHADKFETRVLPRVVGRLGEGEREMVRVAADVVAKALTAIKSANADVE